MVSPNTNRIPQKDKVKQGVSWGVDGAVLATSAVIGSESSPTPQGASSFVQGAGSRSLPGAAEGGGGGTDSYLESYTNVSSWLETTCGEKGAVWFVPGECENGHRFAKTLVCQKEWCPVCGEDRSIAHNRRWLRWLPKVQQFSSMGYFVFTMPEELRAKYRLKTSKVMVRDGKEIIVWTHPLAKLSHDIQELLKSFGFSRGLRRWHYFGDKSTK